MNFTWRSTTGLLGAAAIALVLQGAPVQANDMDFDGGGLDFGSRMQRKLEHNSFHWFGIHDPLGASAPATTGDYRIPNQKAEDQVLLARSLKVEYVTRNVANNADQFAFWPTDEQPTHLIFCIEEFSPSILKDANGNQLFLPNSLIPKWTPGVQRVNLRTGAVETILRGTAGCDGLRRTPWGTILATEEADNGTAYEIINPLLVTNHTITNRTTDTVVDPNGLLSKNVVIRPDTGIFAWEGIAILPNGVMYGGDELRPGSVPAEGGLGPDSDGGAIFKFVPASPRTVNGPINNLNESPFAAGNLYALQVSCIGSSNANYPAGQ